MHRINSSRTIASLVVGIVVAASIVGGVAYVTRASVASADDQLLASADQRSHVVIGSSAADPGRLLHQWTPSRLPKQRIVNHVSTGTPRPSVIHLVQAVKPAAEVAATIAAETPPVLQAAAAPQREDDMNEGSDVGEDSHESDGVEHQGSDD